MVCMCIMIGKKALKKCYKEGYLIIKPTHYGLEVSLNPRMIKKIHKLPEIREIEEK